jgi:hypothetical protein
MLAIHEPRVSTLIKDTIDNRQGNDEFMVLEWSTE